MSTPEEVRRNLGWGAEVLQKISADESINEDLRERAKNAANIYPSLEMIENSKRSDIQVLATILESRKIFTEVLYFESLNAETRRECQVTLRHYPSETDILVAQKSQTPGLRLLQKIKW